MTGSDEDCDRSRRPDVENRGWLSTGQVLGARAIGRLGDAVCGLHRARGDEDHEFFWLSLKTKVYDLSVVWPQNH
jgi:hypothetical protein